MRLPDGRFLASATHPGTQPNDFLARGFGAADRGIDDELERAGERVLANVANSR